MFYFMISGYLEIFWEYFFFLPFKVKTDLIYEQKPLSKLKTEAFILL